MQKRRLGMFLATLFLLSSSITSTYIPSHLEAEQLTDKNIVSVEFKSGRNQINELSEEIQKDEYVETVEIEVVEEIIEEEIVETYEEASNLMYCKFEVSFYTPSAEENGGYAGMTASGEPLQPWVSIALPSDIPFYSEVYIEGLGTFVNHDTGSYIQWTYDEYGNLVCRVDVCVNTTEEAFSLGRFYADGWISIN